MSRNAMPAKRGRVIKALEAPEMWPYGVVVQTKHAARRKGYDVDEETGCWIYEGAKDRDGYGLVNDRSGRRKTSRPAHRFFYVRWVGPIPFNMELDHRCAVRACVNPDHLRIATRQQNMDEWKSRRVPRTHCTRWHRYTKRNVYTRPNGSRECHTCKAAKGYARRHEVDLMTALRWAESRYSKRDLRAIIEWVKSLR